MYKLTFLLFLFKLTLFSQNPTSDKACEITLIKVYNEELLSWKTINESVKKPFIIEEYRWKKWIKIGELMGLGTPNENRYLYKPMPHQGENRFRISLQGEPKTAKEIKHIFKIPAVKFSIQKEKEEILFSAETMFEIINAAGLIQKKGFSKSVSYKDLEPGTHTLNYDNSTTTLKK